MWCAVLLLFLATQSVHCKKASFQPEQVHIAYGDSVYEIVVSWSTLADTKESIVEYGSALPFQPLNRTAVGYSKRFTDGGRKKRTQYVHSASLKNLSPSTLYAYHVGSRFGWSDRFVFRTPPSEDSWQPSLAIFGDLGFENAQSLSRLEEETQQGMYDAILHVGDFAYDMDSHNGMVGDRFMKQIEAIAAYVPYMTCVGNHEERFNFSHYKMRFNMPGDTENLMFSFNMGPLHIISISTELYYFLNYGLKSLILQYNWLENDLKEATDPKNRTERPWIIVMGHRPMYCSNNNPADCTHNSTFTRIGLPFLHMFGLEKLFYDHKVDVLIWAHQHSYERLWPVYDFKVYNGSYENPYLNPLAPMHIVTGSAGCKENHTTFDNDKPYWSAYRSTDYGYTRLKAYNKTHLHIEQVSDDQNGAVIDSFWIVQEKRTF